MIDLARVLCDDEQLDVAEEAASRAINLLPEKGEQLHVCEGHHVLGNIYHSKGETEKAVHHLEEALRIASSLRIVRRLIRIHLALAELFFGEGGLNDAQAHFERAKSHAVDGALLPLLLARTPQLQARVWDQQHIFEEAKSEALRALGVFEKLGATKNAESTRKLLRQIDCNAQGNGLRSSRTW